MKSGPNILSRSCSSTRTGLPQRVVLFSRFLRDHGFKVFPSSIVEALQSLQEGDVCSKEDFFNILRTNLVVDEMEWKRFDGLFDVFWREIDLEEEENAAEDENQPADLDGDLPADKSQEVSVAQEGEVEAACNEEAMRGVTYSPVALLERRSLAQFEREEVQIAQLLLKNLMSPFRVSVTRRFRRSKKPGDIDFRRIFKKGLRGEGLPLELLYRKKKKRLKKLVVLADVSGSMDRYARFVMPFIIGLKGVGTRAEVFVFSTSLTRITTVLRRFDIDKALEIISGKVPDWSGGTRIGYSLHQFNLQYGKRHLNKRTVVVIMSDGWDLGARNLLKGEMETLARKVSDIVWLNPLAGDPGYKPICRGMQAALPYIDYFLPADSLESLRRVGRTLSRVMVGGR
ncbi:MAG: VWA domain-containing protein [Proteobacteria bacterium]|nr:VWA domain-containing protein [Pseudomonadota bacterium]